MFTKEFQHADSPAGDRMFAMMVWRQGQGGVWAISISHLPFKQLYPFSESFPPSAKPLVVRPRQKACWAQHPHGCHGAFTPSVSNWPEMPANVAIGGVDVLCFATWACDTSGSGVVGWDRGSQLASGVRCMIRFSASARNRIKKHAKDYSNDYAIL
ncbi:hypothetical protein LX36DRAFT_459876 [Colletotrichum falcatum]|nr:hypothetical protein LX36DRAFT_459876 [Colletotrichum falcatum]